MIVVMEQGYATAPGAAQASATQGRGTGQPVSSSRWWSMT